MHRIQRCQRRHTCPRHQQLWSCDHSQRFRRLNPSTAVNFNAATCSEETLLLIGLLSRGVEAWDIVWGAEGRPWQLFRRGHLSVGQRDSAHRLLSSQQHTSAGQCDCWKQIRHVWGPAGFEPAHDLACLSGKQWKPECAQWLDYSESGWVQRITPAMWGCVYKARNWRFNPLFWFCLYGHPVLSRVLSQV